MKKIIGALALFFFAFFPCPVLAEEIPIESSAEEHEEEVIGERIDVGYFEVWLHADGTTWQDTDYDGKLDKPYIPQEGDKPEPIPEYIRNYTFEAQPYDEWEEEYKDIRVEADLEWFDAMTEEKYTALGGAGKVDIEGNYEVLDYKGFKQLVLRRLPYGYKLTSNLESQLYLFDKEVAENIKRDWQKKLVQGWRWYLPVHLTFYGTPKIQEPPEPPVVAPPMAMPCQEKQEITRTWEELYSWKITRHRTYRSKKTGKKRTKTWTETRYATPTYTETLSADLTLNTKQGDPEGGRESRGSWEIIPWAKNYRLDPNKVTRSGYGFEVKVVTKYTNDWECHVPAKASPHGGTYQGPTKCIAEFYDNKGHCVNRAELVPSKGKAGDNNITWELPARHSKFSDGTSVWERKHYTDVKTPDGKYWVKVTVSGAGKMDMCLIRRDYITIYGDMYDDSYTRPSTKDE